MRSRKQIILALIFAGLVLLLVVVLIRSSMSEPPVHIAVWFAGVTNDATGAPMTVFTIKNDGDATVVIWGDYQLHAQQEFGRRRYPMNFGVRYMVLAPGHSERVAIHTPETKGPWQITIAYGNHDLVSRLNLPASYLPLRFRHTLPNEIQNPPRELANSDWVTESMVRRALDLR
jgi:hypothetical protein